MGIGSIGSTASFWQQDQNFWQKAQENDNSTAASNAVINAIGAAETNLGKGLASIANQTALSRVNTQLSAAIQNLLQPDTSGSASSSSSSSSSSSASSASANSSPTAAVATGTAPLSMSTSLASLGIRAGGSITVSAGGDTTIYASTGNDTVGNLIGALDSNAYGNAPVTASLGRDGRLVITSKNTTNTITIGGVYASNIGFGVGNQTFKPTQGASNSSSTSATSGTSAASTSSATTSKTSSSTSTAAPNQSYPTLAAEMSSSAASLLSDSGVGGTLVDMLA